MNVLPVRLSTGAATPVLAGLLVFGLLGAVPAKAQWIGAAGGSGESSPSSGAVMVAPVPQDEQAAPGYNPGFSAGPTEAPPQPNPNVSECQSGMVKLRDEVEARGTALQKAAKAKRPPSELCPLFRNFANAQQGFYSFLNTNKTKCGVPDDVLKKIKANANSVVSTRDRVCEVAKMQESGGGPGGPPPQGAISAGLGLSTGLPTTGAPPGGVFDTLGGDALR